MEGVSDDPNLKYYYKLSIFGNEDMMRAYKETKGQTEVKKLWDTERPFAVRRRSFPLIPSYMRLSRKHFQFKCEVEEPGNKRSIFGTDTSSNGTLLNGEPMERNTSHRLVDGDKLGLIWKKLPDNSIEVLFGLQLHIYDEKSAPLAPLSSVRVYNGKKPRKTKSESYADDMDELDGRGKRSRDNEFYEGEGKRSKYSNSSNSSSSTGHKAKSDKHLYGSSSYDDDSKTGLKMDRLIKQWTPEEEEKLVEVISLSDNKLSWKDIAAHFPHRSPDAVRNKFKKMSESSSSGALKNLGTKIVSSKTLATPSSSSASGGSSNSSSTASNSSTSTHHHNAKQAAAQDHSNEEDRRRKLWTPEEDTRLKELVIMYKPSKQEDWEAIALQLGRTIKSVKHKFNDYNLKALLDDPHATLPSPTSTPTATPTTTNNNNTTSSTTTTPTTTPTKTEQ